MYLSQRFNPVKYNVSLIMFNPIITTKGKSSVLHRLVNIGIAVTLQKKGTEVSVRFMSFYLSI